MSSKEEFCDRPEGVKIVFGENGLMAKDQTAQEVDLAQVMTRKRGCGSLLDQRNGFPCTSLGDKYYKHPEYSVGYWKGAEVTVGASFVRGTYPKTIARNSTAWKAFAAENPNAVKTKTYVAVRKAQLEREQERDVIQLTNWEKKTLIDCPDANFSETLELLEEPSDDEDTEAEEPKEERGEE